MPRTKGFVPDDALQGALDMFRAKGYEATSMADLVEALGVGKASLYATFGSKHDLYLRALARYVAMQQPDPIALLSQPGPALPAVRMLVEWYRDMTLNDEDRRGCMVVGAAVERMPFDREAARVVEATWGEMEAALAGALTRARAQGEIAADADPRALAGFLLVVLQGIRLMARSEGSASRVRAAADVALRALGRE
jgi:TetR/AcrR family transcriptional regulator, transcriptional repressor for nem operon